MKSDKFDLKAFVNKLIDERDFLDRFARMPASNFRNKTLAYTFLEGIEELEKFIKCVRIEIPFTEVELKLRNIENLIGKLQTLDGLNQSYVTTIQETISEIDRVIFIARGEF